MCFFKNQHISFIFITWTPENETRFRRQKNHTLRRTFPQRKPCFYSYSVTRIFRNGHMVFKNNVFAKAVCNIYAQLFIFSYILTLIYPFSVFHSHERHFPKRLK